MKKIILSAVLLTAILTGCGNETTEKVQENQQIEQKAEVKKYGIGQYKVSEDIPAGEYIAVGEGYLELMPDST